MVAHYIGLVEIILKIMSLMVVYSLVTMLKRMFVLMVLLESPEVVELFTGLKKVSVVGYKFRILQ